jgi:hypothetical protein
VKQTVSQTQDGVVICSDVFEQLDGVELIVSGNNTSGRWKFENQPEISFVNEFLHVGNPAFKYTHRHLSQTLISNTKIVLINKWIDLYFQKSE